MPRREQDGGQIFLHDYTFGVWKNNELIPIAKAYSGLDQTEINKLDHWIRKNTEKKFVPVRKVKAKHVFEIGFERIQKSNRHKSQVALRFPRICVGARINR